MLKTRIQTASGTSLANTSIRQLGLDIFRKEGFLAFYRGSLFPVTGYGMANAASFTSFKLGMHAQEDIRESLGTPVVMASAGAFSGVVSSFVRAPIEQIKTVMQAQKASAETRASPYRNSLTTLVHVLKTEGVYKGLYRGLGPTVARETIQNAIYYPSYHFFKNTLIDYFQADSKAAPVLMTAGGLAGCAIWIFTYPIDVVKSTIHVVPAGKYPSMLACAKDLYKQEGKMVFIRGMDVALYRAFPLHGLIFWGYENTYAAICNSLGYDPTTF